MPTDPTVSTQSLPLLLASFPFLRAVPGKHHIHSATGIRTEGIAQPDPSSNPNLKKWPGHKHWPDTDRLWGTWLDFQYRFKHTETAPKVTTYR